MKNFFLGSVWEMFMRDLTAPKIVSHALRLNFSNLEFLAVIDGNNVENLVSEMKILGFVNRDVNIFYGN